MEKRKLGFALKWSETAEGMKAFTNKVKNRIRQLATATLYIFIIVYYFSIIRPHLLYILYPPMHSLKTVNLYYLKSIMIQIKVPTLIVKN